ncbi:TylF/MycF family methyltransferase [Brucepastera parasyntrophica]|uniref:TylF/MycF family methyltransferase n=1 Tax=Brucepastera parasyntrophica TaxID=2880008 RepID=UPI00210D672F|nr:TylF/MycF family methyltransferase [Brucepastera parasyntrophica]
MYRGAFAKYINAEFPDKTCYLFDTFQGFPESDLAADKKSNFSNPGTGEFTDTSAEAVRGILPNPGKCSFREGYFPDTAKGLEAEDFCFVSIDTDLYASVYAALGFFYRRLVSGGYIMVHDYDNPDYLGVREAVLKAADEEHFACIPVPDGGGSIVIGKP